MSTPQQPENVSALIADLERRVRTLEASPRAENTSIHDGYTEVIDDEGRRRVRIGKVVRRDGSANFGLAIWDANGGSALWLDGDGFNSPWMSWGTYPAVGNYTDITSDDWVDVYRANVQLTTHGGLGVLLTGYCPLGNSGELRVTVGESSSGILPVSEDKFATKSLQWLHGVPLGVGPVIFNIKARRTGGDGYVRVYDHGSMAMIDPLQCTESGF